MESSIERWKLRFKNFDKAHIRFCHALEVVRSNPGEELLESGLIQIYES